MDSADFYWKNNVDIQSNIKACTETKASTSEGINWVVCSSTFDVYVRFKLASMLLHTVRFKSLFTCYPGTYCFLVSKFHLASSIIKRCPRMIFSVRLPIMLNRM